MNSQQWKNVLDQLDEDIVNSAAERLSSAESDEDPSQYPADSSPREYKNISRKKKRGGLFIGIGSVAAAAAVTGIVLVRNVPVQQETSELTDGASFKAASAVTTTAPSPLVVEDAAGLVSSFTAEQGHDIDVFPAGFSGASLTLFEEYFYGAWTGEETTIDLCYSANSAFGGDYTCTGIDQTDGGCYMGAQDGTQYDLWYVRPDDNSGMMYIFRNVSLSDGVIQYNDDGTISCGSTESFQLSSTSPDEYNTIGYFGKVKLADNLGMTPEALYSQATLDTYAGSDAGEAHWIRSESGYSSPWDKVVLKSKAEDSIVMSMAFTQSDDPLRTMYFDMYWYLTDSGEWALQDVQKSRDVFALTADDLRVTLTLSDLDIFEMYFAGTWASDTEEFVLSYSQDIFNGIDCCGGFYTDQDGWYMYQLIDATETPYTQVYYVPYSDPFTMYLYEPDIYGYAAQENYLAEYTHTDSGLDELDTSHMSWIGLQRWILDTQTASGDDTLSAAVYSAFSDIGNDYSNAGNYNGGGDAFGGYAVEELSSGSWRLTFQLFDQENNSQWVSVVLKNADNQWELLPADGITADTVG